MSGISVLFRKSIQLVPWKLRSSIKDLPLLGPAQRFVVNRFLGKRSFLHTVDAGPARGLRIWIELPGDKQIWTGTYESEFALTLAQSVRRGDVTYDVGAFHGFMAGIMALAGASNIIAFEPLPQNLRRIEALAALNPNLPLQVRPMAVGDRDGNAKFEEMLEESMGKLSESGFQSSHRGLNTFEVVMRSIDSLVGAKEIPPPNLIKVDVEGAELQVLKGAMATLREFRPMLFLEAHSVELADQCSAFLVALGYRITRLQMAAFRGDTGISHLKATPQPAV